MSTRILHYTLRGKDQKQVKLSTDVDTLYPDATHYSKVETVMSNQEIITHLECEGFKVCLDLPDYFYETESN